MMHAIEQNLMADQWRKVASSSIEFRLRKNGLMAQALIAPQAMAHQWRTPAALPPPAPLASRAYRSPGMNTNVRCRSRAANDTVSAMQQVANTIEPVIKRRKRAISPRIVHAIELIASGRARTQSEAASIAGVSEEWLSKMLGRQEMGVLLEQTCRKFLRKGSVRATARLVELLDSSSARTSLEASKHVLGIHGIRPPPDGVNVSANVQLSVGYVIDLRGPGDAAPLVIDGVSEEQPSATPADRSGGYGR